MLTEPRVSGFSEARGLQSRWKTFESRDIADIAAPRVRTTLASAERPDRPRHPAAVDGRQSPVAPASSAACVACSRSSATSTLPEFTLANGRRADVIALAPDGALTIVEIKSCVADFRADRKWPDYEDFCDRFYFAVPETMPSRLLPEDRGLIVADAFGAAIMRDAHAPSACAARGARR